MKDHDGIAVAADVEPAPPPRAPAAAVVVGNVGKKFCRHHRRSLGYGLADIASELVGRRRVSNRLRPGEFWALEDVSFAVAPGQALGLVGPNGAGKSTLLRLISGLIKPDAGSITVRGRVAPLIALGAGFNPVLSGRENVYVNMSILGVSKAEIQARFEEVVEFADLGDALDAPVQTYSSGMAARLGFACALHTSPDVLLIDEVLAVGDMQFRRKCYRQLAKLLERGACFMLVSHSPHTIMAMCSHAIYLSGGRVVTAGDTGSVMYRYEQDLLAMAGSSPNGAVTRHGADGSGPASILRVSLRDQLGVAAKTAVSGEPVSLWIECGVRQTVDDVSLIVAVSSATMENERILHLSSQYDDRSWTVEPGNVVLELQLPYCGLVAGLYSAKVVLLHRGLEVLAVVESFRFTVSSGTVSEGNLFHQPRRWQLRHLPSRS